MESHHVWPKYALLDAARSNDEPMRPFLCVVLTPFSSPRFEELARIIEGVVRDRTNALLPTVVLGETRVERLDWVQAAGAVQTQIWDRVGRADLIFCDVTGQNANVMFEAGVAAATKNIQQVVFLRDAFYRLDQPFDIAPFRFLTYVLTGEGIDSFRLALRRYVDDAIIPFPDALARLGERQPVTAPVELDFAKNRDDVRLITPPFAHRQARGGVLEFGSLWSFPHSWATVGQERYASFRLSFGATFTKLHPSEADSWIGVGFRSQHFFPGFAYILYLRRNGQVAVAIPEDTPEGSRDRELRPPTEIDPGAVHHFDIEMTETAIRLRVDEFEALLEVNALPKLLGSGLIRLQAYQAWMGVSWLSLHT